MNLHRQRGFTLLELMAALAIGMLMLLGLTAMLDMSLQDMKGQQAGQYQAQFVAAATRYLGDQYAVLLPANTGVLTRTTVSIADLQSVGLLSASFAATNAYNQTPCMLLRSPAAGQIDALIVTEGGDDIPEADISYLAANAGAGGGAITHDIPGDPTSATVARGIHGGWALTNAQLNQFIPMPATLANTCSGTPAGLWRLATALFFGGAGQVQNDFLYRSPVNGDVSFNRMNTPIGMGGDALVTSGSRCTTAAIAMDSTTGHLLTCHPTNKVWEDAVATSWKAPRASYAALPKTGLMEGDVYVTTDTGRAYMWDGGTIVTGKWLALALDSTGNLQMEGNLTMTGGNLAMTDGNLKLTGGNLDINGGNLNLKGVTPATGTGTVPGTGDLTMTGNLVADGRINAASGIVSGSYVSAQSLSLHRVVNTETPCNLEGEELLPDGTYVTILPPGTLAKDIKNVTMMCHEFDPEPGPRAGRFVYLDNTLDFPTYVGPVAPP